MTKIRKFKKIMNPLVFTALLYIAMCVWMYMTAVVTVQDVALPQHDAGIIALATWHVILVFAIGMAWLLGKAVDLISRIKKK